MSTPRTSPLTALRGGLWGFLTFTGVAWLAIGWSVLRLEPSDVARVTGPVILFGALTEALRALTGGRMWGLNAGMAVLFAATGGLILADLDATLTTPSALIGWYLMVRGAADIAMSVLSRGDDRTWGLMLGLGVAQAGLGFYAASSLARTLTVVIMVLGGLALVRAVADLVAAMSLREVPAGSETAREHAAGVAGYAAGLADYAAAAAARSGRPRHRAAGVPATRYGDDDAVVGEPAGAAPQGGVDTVRAPVETTANLDAVLALAGVSGAVLSSRWNDELVEPAATDAGRTARQDRDPLSQNTLIQNKTGRDKAGEELLGLGLTGQGLLGEGAAGYRVPAGPPAGMSIHGGAPMTANARADSTVAGSTVRISPIAAEAAAESLATTIEAVGSRAPAAEAAAIQATTVETATVEAATVETATVEAARVETAMVEAAAAGTGGFDGFQRAGAGSPGTEQAVIEKKRGGNAGAVTVAADEPAKQNFRTGLFRRKGPGRRRAS